MIDPFPIAPPAWLVRSSKPLCDALNLQSLPLHLHEILIAAAFYTVTCSIVSPWLSTLVFPRAYKKLSRKSKLNWDVHVTSFIQSILICSLSLWVIFCDGERASFRPKERWAERIWAYYGSGGLCQSFALGYFLWDLFMCSLHIDMFGAGMLAHALSACAVFALGYRPFIYFTAPIFLLYELSSPFLNIHWFCDKLDMTGSTLQAVNGGFLVLTFFSCRLVWGVYNSVLVFRDCLNLLSFGQTNFAHQVPSGRISTLSTAQLLAISKHPKAQLNAFNSDQYIPLWIPLVYLISNVTLNSLNIFWFGKMIQTIRTRFDPPWGTKGVGPEKVHYAPQYSEENLPAAVEKHAKVATLAAADDLDSTDVDSDLGINNKTPKSGKKKGSVRAARAKAEEALKGPVGTVEDTKFDRSGFEADGVKSVRSRRKG